MKSIEFLLAHMLTKLRRMKSLTEKMINRKSFATLTMSVEFNCFRLQETIPLSSFQQRTRPTPRYMSAVSPPHRVSQLQLVSGYHTLLACALRNIYFTFRRNCETLVFYSFVIP